MLPPPFPKRGNLPPRPPATRSAPPECEVPGSPTLQPAPDFYSSPPSRRTPRRGGPPPRGAPRPSAQIHAPRANPKLPVRPLGEERGGGGAANRKSPRLCEPPRSRPPRDALQGPRHPSLQERPRPRREEGLNPSAFPSPQDYLEARSRLCASLPLSPRPPALQRPSDPPPPLLKRRKAPEGRAEKGRAEKGRRREEGGTRSRALGSRKRRHLSRRRLWLRLSKISFKPHSFPSLPWS